MIEKKKFKLKQKISINLNLIIKLFLFVAKYLNYIPWINKIVDKFITLVTNNKLKTDEFIKKGF